MTLSLSHRNKQQLFMLGEPFTPRCSRKGLLIIIMIGYFRLTSLMCSRSPFKSSVDNSYISYQYSSVSGVCSK